MFEGVKKKLSIGLLVVVVLGVALVVYNLVAPKHIYATSTVLSILGGSNVWVAEKADDWQPAEDGETLKEGWSVKTGAGSYALITFFDGSTVEIEPNTEILIETMEGKGDSSVISIFQKAGRTWHRVEKLADPSSRYQVKTPAATGAVRGTLVDIVVNVKETLFKTIQGIMEVFAQDKQQTVEAGMQTSVEQGKEPQKAAPIPPPAGRLEFSLSGEAAFIRVVDPSNRTAGLAPPGIVVNQISGAVSSGAMTQPQLITIPDPITGRYTVVIEGSDAGQFGLTVKGFSGASPAFGPAHRNGTISTVNGKPNQFEKYIAKLDVTVNSQGAISNAVLGQLELLEGDAPGKVVKQLKAAEKADVPVAPEANFTVDVSADGRSISLISLSTGDISGYTWNFGDGAPVGNEANPSHFYAKSGAFTVTLTVTGPGGTDTKAKEIYVVTRA